MKVEYPASVFTQSRMQGRGKQRKPPILSGTDSRWAKQRPPMMGRSVGSAKDRSRSSVCCSKPMSASIMNSHSHGPSRKFLASSLRPSGMPPAPHLIIAHEAILRGPDMSWPTRSKNDLWKLAGTSFGWRYPISTFRGESSPSGVDSISMSVLSVHLMSDPTGTRVPLLAGCGRCLLDDRYGATGEAGRGRLCGEQVGMKPHERIIGGPYVALAEIDGRTIPC